MKYTISVQLYTISNHWLDQVVNDDFAELRNALKTTNVALLSFGKLVKVFHNSKLINVLYWTPSGWGMDA